MNRIQSGIIVILFSMLFSGCKDPDTTTNEISIEPTGSSYYYIKNETDFDLFAQFPVPTYDRSIDSIILIDSIVTISRLTTTKLFEDLGNFGLNPTPTHTFKNIRFFNSVNGEKVLVLEISPVKTDQWTPKIIDRDQYGYGQTEYQFVLHKENL